MKAVQLAQLVKKYGEEVIVVINELKQESDQLRQL